MEDRTALLGSSTLGQPEDQELLELQHSFQDQADAIQTALAGNLDAQSQDPAVQPLQSDSDRSATAEEEVEETSLGLSDPPSCDAMTDVKPLYSNESENEETNEVNVAELNQCFQDHVNVIRSRPAVHYMLSDTEYSDFDESEDEGPTARDWTDLQQLLQGHADSTRLPLDDTESDFYTMSDVEESDVQGQGAAEASPSQGIADVFQFDSDTEYELPDLPALTPAEFEEMWKYAPPRGVIQSPSTPDVMHFNSDFDESDDEGPIARAWMELQQLLQGHADSTRLPLDDTQSDFYTMSDVEESDVQGQGAAEASPSQGIADVFQFDSDTEYELPDLPSLTPAEFEEMWKYAPPRGVIQSPSTPDVMHFNTEQRQSAESASSQLLHFTPEEVERLWSATVQKQREAFENYQFGSAQQYVDHEQSEYVQRP